MSEQDKLYGMPPGSQQVIADLCRTVIKHNEILIRFLEVGVTAPNLSCAEIKQIDIELRILKDKLENERP